MQGIEGADAQPARQSHWQKFEEEVLANGVKVEVPHPEHKLIIPLKVFDILEDEILVSFTPPCDPRSLHFTQFHKNSNIFLEQLSTLEHPS